MSNIDQQLALAQIAESEGRLTDALRAYRNVLDVDPKEVDAMVGVGRITLAIGDLQVALEYFTAGLVRDPDCVEALRGRGLVFHNLGMAEQAMADLNRAVALQPRIVEPRLSRALVALELDKNTLAAADLRRLREHAGDDPDVALAWAQCLARMDSGPDSRPLARQLGRVVAQLVAAFPDDPLVDLLGATAEAYSGELERATASLRDVLAREPELREEAERIPVMSSLLDAITREHDA